MGKSASRWASNPESDGYGWRCPGCDTFWVSALRSPQYVYVKGYRKKFRCDQCLAGCATCNNPLATYQEKYCSRMCAKSARRVVGVTRP